MGAAKALHPVSCFKIKSCTNASTEYLQVHMNVILSRIHLFSCILITCVCENDFFSHAQIYM